VLVVAHGSEKMHYAVPIGPFNAHHQTVALYRNNRSFSAMKAIPDRALSECNSTVSRACCIVLLKIAKLETITWYKKQ